jgi:hypothetical protein
MASSPRVSERRCIRRAYSRKHAASTDKTCEVCSNFTAQASISFAFRGSCRTASHLRSRHHRELLFIAELVGRVENMAAGIFQVPFQLSRDTAGVKQVLRKYKDRKIELADACLIRLADQFGIGNILTLDQDFTIYRWGRNKPFRVLPSRELARRRESP